VKDPSKEAVIYEGEELCNIEGEGTSQAVPWPTRMNNVHEDNTRIDGWFELQISQLTRVDKCCGNHLSQRTKDLTNE